MAFKRTLAAIVLGIASLGIGCNHETREQEKPVVISSEQLSVKTEVQQEKPLPVKPNKTSSLIDILDDDYESEILVDGLMEPENITLCHSTKQFFFTQLGSYEFSKGIDITKYDNCFDLWKKYGGNKEVFELVDGKPVRRFNGSQDTWGGFHFIRIHTNSKDQIGIHQQTAINESLSVYDLKTGEQRINLQKHDLKERLKGNILGMNFFDNTLYIPTSSEVILSLDASSGKVSEWCKRNEIPFWDRPIMPFCSDANGNFYVTVNGYGYTWVTKINSDKKMEKTRFQKPDKVAVDNFYPWYTAFDNTRRKLVMAGLSSRKQEDSGDCVFEADLEKRELSAIAKLRLSRYLKGSFQITGLDVDDNGIYISVISQRSGGEIDYVPGKIIRIKRK